MTTEIMMGAPRTCRLMRDEAGYRTYEVQHIVQGFEYSPGVWPGPAEVIQTAGLPVPGNYWLVDNDVDLWAWVRMDTSVDPYEHKSGPITKWIVKHHVSNRPPELYNPTGAGGPGGHEEQNSPLMCAGMQIEDPLLQPMKVSGSFIKDKREAAYDRFDKQIKNSSHEIMRGAPIEFAEGYPTVHIEQNVVDLQFSLCNELYNHVNSTAMWGVPIRAVRLADFKWERKFYGLCYVYYTRSFEFEIKLQRDPDNLSTFIGGWDKFVADEGTKCIRGVWVYNEPTDDWFYQADTGVSYDNPAHFKRFIDTHHNPTRTLLFKGFPAGAAFGGGPDPGKIKVEYYRQDNLLVKLGLPITF